MRGSYFKIGKQRGSIPRDVIDEAVRYIMEKTNYKPKPIRIRAKKSSPKKVK